MPIQEVQIRSLGWEDPLEREMATQSSALAGEALVSYSPWGRKESDTAEHTHTLSLAGNGESVFLHTAGSSELFRLWGRQSEDI